jgi:hypothetical protein
MTAEGRPFTAAYGLTPNAVRERYVQMELR